MSKLSLQGRTLSVFAILVPLFGLLIYVALRSGPLAPVSVAESRVESREIHPALFGVGTVEARRAYLIGPSATGRVRRVLVDVGDAVKAGQLLAEMDPVDLNERVSAMDAASERARSLEAGAEARLLEARSHRDLADIEARRYTQLGAKGFVSKSTVDVRLEQLKAAEAQLAGEHATLDAARQEYGRLLAESGGARQQRQNSRLVATADGIVTARAVDPGTTIIAGQTVVEVIDPQSVWINVRFDQISALGLAANLPARIVLRSRGGQTLQGQVLRVEPKADAVTEEALAKVVFTDLPTPLPPIGELAEVTVDLPALPMTPTIPNAAIQHQDGQAGVWQIINSEPHFVPVKLGRTDLNGWVQVLEGLKTGDRIVVYSEKAITARSRIRIVERIPGTER